jgi:hypothetical protein
MTSLVPSAPKRRAPRWPFLLAWLLVSSTVGAEDATVPISLQAKLLGKLAGYDRNMKARAGDRVRVGILIKAHNPDSERIGRQLQHELGEVPSFGGIPHEETALEYEDAAALARACTARHLAVVFVTAGFDRDLEQIARSLVGVDVLTVSAVAAYVPKGIVIGFDVVGGETKILIHLTQAKEQHVAFTADVLKLMKVYR